MVETKNKTTWWFESVIRGYLTKYRALFFFDSTTFEYRAKKWTKFRWFFGVWENLVICFRDLLTFRIIFFSQKVGTILETKCKSYILSNSSGWFEWTQVIKLQYMFLNTFLDFLFSFGVKNHLNVYLKKDCLYKSVCTVVE